MNPTDDSSSRPVECAPLDQSRQATSSDSESRPVDVYDLSLSGLGELHEICFGLHGWKLRHFSDTEIPLLLQEFAAALPRPALLIAGTLGEKGTGLDVAHACREIDPGLKLIVLSGYDPKELKAMLRIGRIPLMPDLMISRPVRLEVLLWHADKLLRQAGRAPEGGSRAITPPSSEQGGEFVIAPFRAQGRTGKNAQTKQRRRAASPDSANRPAEVYFLGDLGVGEIHRRWFAEHGRSLRVFAPADAHLLPLAFATACPRPGLLIIGSINYAVTGLTAVQACWKIEPGLKLIAAGGHLESTLQHIFQSRGVQRLPEVQLRMPCDPAMLLRHAEKFLRKARRAPGVVRLKNASRRVGTNQS